jgi:hypothetical protein
MSPLTTALVAVGLFYLGLGVIFGIVYVAGGVESSLFPTGWLFPAVLIVTGTLMARRLRFDIVATLWGGLALAVFLLDVLVHVSGLGLRFDDPAAFDATIIVASFGLVALLLRPQFRG